MTSTAAARLQSMIKSREKERQMDIAESRQLLLELGTQDPTILQCLSILQSTALTQKINVKIGDKELSPEFVDFVNKYYKQECYHAIQAMFMYGFVPWRIRTLSSGDKVPEVLPPGTFTWSVKPNSEESVNHTDNTTILRYEVQCLHVGIENDDVFIHTVYQPKYKITETSNIYATMPSPLSHILQDYKALREAQIRRSHADKWNTTARVVTAYHPPRQSTDNPASSLLQNTEVGDLQLPMLSYWKTRDHQIEDQFGKLSNHNPAVYNMPRDVTVQPLSNLNPCEDLQFLNEKFHRNVCALFGVPPDVLSSNKGTGKDLVKRVALSGRVFSASIQKICATLQDFMQHVYQKIYSNLGKKQSNLSPVEFVLTPIPRLDVESIDDLKILHEIGILTADASANISNMLLGVNPTGVINQDSNVNIERRQFGSKSKVGRKEIENKSSKDESEKSQEKKSANTTSKQ